MTDEARQRRLQRREAARRRRLRTTITVTIVVVVVLVGGVGAYAWARTRPAKQPVASTDALTVVSSTVITPTPVA